MNSCSYATNTAPLNGFYFDFTVDETANEYELAPDLYLIKMPQLKSIDKIEKAFGRINAENIRRCNWAIQHRYVPEPDKLLGPKAKESDNLIFLAQISLWITRPTAAHADFLIKYHPLFPDDDASTTERVSKIFHGKKYDEETFFSTDIELLEKILFGVKVVYDFDNKMKSALEFLSIALQSYFWKVRFVNFAIILECIFSTDSIEISHKLSERIAFFLEDEQEKRKETFKTMKKIYSIRSRIVHGSALNFNDNEIKEMETLADTLEITTQRIMKRILLDDKLREILTSTNQIREDYLMGLIFT